MYKLLWIAVLVFVWGCTEPSAPVDEKQSPSVADFAIQPERKPSDIRTELDKQRKASQQEAASLIEVPVYVYKPFKEGMEDVSSEDMAPFDKDIEDVFSEDLVPFEESKTKETEASGPLVKKLEALLSQLSQQQRRVYAAIGFEVSPSLTKAQRRALLVDIVSAGQTRQPDWKEAEAAWAA